MSCFSVEIIEKASLAMSKIFILEFGSVISRRDTHSWTNRITVEPTMIEFSIRDTTEGQDLVSLGAPVINARSTTVVVISLEPKQYLVRENELDPLRVCANLSHPIDFDFSVLFILQDSAGNGKRVCLQDFCQFFISRHRNSKSYWNGRERFRQSMWRP